MILTFLFKDQLWRPMWKHINHNESVHATSLKSIMCKMHKAWKHEDIKSALELMKSVVEIVQESQ